MQTAKISLARMKTGILVSGAIGSCAYIAFLLVMEALHLMDITGLRMVNYLILFMVCFFQVKKWIKQNQAYVPFLQVFSTAFFTGVWSFILFSAFLLLYAHYDTHLTELFIQNTAGFVLALPSIVILVEGSGASIIVALVVMEYFSWDEEKREGQKAVK